MNRAEAGKKMFVSEGWDGDYVLLNKQGIPVLKNSLVGDGIVVGARAPHKPSSCGFIHIQKEGNVREVYVTCYEMKWERAAEFLSSALKKKKIEY